MLVKPTPPKMALQHRCLILAGFGAALLWSLAACEQPSPKPRITIYTLLPYPILDESIAGIKEGLAQSGYGTGTVTLKEVNANGQTALVDSFAKEIVSNKPDVIVPVSTPIAQAVVHEAPVTQNVVFSTVTNPADVGMDKHPANVTGVSDVVNYEANLKLIRELFPKAQRIGIVYNPSERNSQYGLERVKALAGPSGFRLTLLTASNSGEVVNAVRSLTGSVDVLYVGSDNTVASAIDGVVAVANKAHLPVVASDEGSVEKGALAAVSVDYRELGRAAGQLVAKVIKSHRPAGQFQNVLFVGNALVLNTKAASALNYQFPQSVLGRNPRMVGAAG